MYELAYMIKRRLLEEVAESVLNSLHMQSVM
jgi:hypothetical protein